MKRPLTPMEIGGLLTLVAMIVFCCLGVVVTSTFEDSPAPVPTTTYHSGPDRSFP